jgi:hypothetical protein
MGNFHAVGKEKNGLVGTLDELPHLVGSAEATTHHFKADEHQRRVVTQFQVFAQVADEAAYRIAQVFGTRLEKWAAKGVIAPVAHGYHTSFFILGLRRFEIG